MYVLCSLQGMVLCVCKILSAASDLTAVWTGTHVSYIVSLSKVLPYHIQFATCLGLRWNSQMIATFAFVSTCVSIPGYLVLCANTHTHAL